MKFQFTRPQGARLARSIARPTMRCFNSRARKGRDVGTTAWSTTASRFQFTRPQGARRVRIRHRGDWLKFQFTRPQGARRHLEGVRERPRSFNSRARKGRDWRRRWRYLSYWFQFTRPQGARPHAEGSGSVAEGFNSRARKGRDSVSSSASDVSTWFQFTRPQGARPPEHCPDDYAVKFQFTRPQGARQECWYKFNGQTPVSIHAPARGATSPAGSCAHSNPVSIHAPARGATLAASCEPVVLTVSIHAPARGATQDERGKDSHHGFNSRARKGRDRR